MAALFYWGLRDSQGCETQICETQPCELKKLAGNHNGFGEKEIRENYSLGAPSNIARLKKSLIDKELIEITKDGIIIGDPVLRFWLKKVL